MNINLSTISIYKKYFLWGAGVITAVIILLFLVSNLTQKTFYKGIYIENIHMAGLDKTKAEEILNRKATEILNNEKLILKSKESEWIINLSDISFKYRVAATIDKAYSIGRQGNIFQKLKAIHTVSRQKTNILFEPEYDIKKLTALLNNIKSQIDRESRNASFTYKSGNTTINREVTGRFVDIDKCMKLIENKIKNKEFSNIVLDIEEKKPQIFQEDIKEMTSVISVFTTTFNAKDVNRTHNIRLACESISGMILLPGDIFSMNRALGPRTLENGYKDAPVIFQNELIQGPGGGVCQVSTTLYGAVLRSKIDVLERTHHTLPLGYVEPGQDATIAEDYIDFKFQNDQDYAIGIHAEVIGGTLNIRLISKKPSNDHVVKIRSYVVEQRMPEGEEVIIDNTITDGQKVIVREAKKGLRAVVYRETYSKSGQLLEKEKISDDEYKPVKAQVKVNQSYNKPKPAAPNQGL